MNLDNVIDRSEVALREALALEKSLDLAVGRLDQHCERILKENFRSRLIKEININLKPIMEKVAATERIVIRDRTMTYDERLHEHCPAESLDCYVYQKDR